jgi:hypothetical protein
MEAAITFEIPCHAQGIFYNFPKVGLGRLFVSGKILRDVIGSISNDFWRAAVQLPPEHKGFFV